MSSRGGRSLGVAALLASTAAGLSWAATFPIAALVAPVVVPLLAVSAVDQLTLGRRYARALRPALGFLGGIVVLTGVLVLGGAALADVPGHLAGSWHRAMTSTLPVRPESASISFVAVLAVLAAVLGTEWARWGAGPAGAVAPALAVLVLGQLFHAASGGTAIVIAVGFGLAATASVLAVARSSGSRQWWSVVRSPQTLVTLVVAVIAGTAATGPGIPADPPYSIRPEQAAGDWTITAVDPLDQIAGLLVAGDRVVFTARADRPVGRWPLVVLDRFDGDTWSSDARLLRLGLELPPAPFDVSAVPARAEISDLDVDGPWLPSQPRLRTATGVDPLVDPSTGMLVSPNAEPVARYVLQWDQPRIDAAALTASTLDAEPVDAIEPAAVPAGFGDLARQAVGPDAAPTVQAALVLERWLRDNYDVATDDLPTGHSYAQLLHFLNVSKRGTSEQFSTSYALMARSLGIPVRVVVGFRDDGSGIVRGDDVLAWPEVAVSGLGWVPLDPTGGADSSSAGNDLAAATDAARSTVPDASGLAARQPGPPPPTFAPIGTAASGPSWWLVLAAVVLALVLLVAAVPTAKVTRRMIRRRADEPGIAVLNAWRDTRDGLLDYGVPVTAGSTVRELAHAAPVEEAHFSGLAWCVDGMRWVDAADAAMVRTAWDSARAVRRALRTQPARRRLRATFSVVTFGRRPLRSVVRNAGRSGPE